MATDPLDYDLTDAENGDTDAMARVLQSLIPDLLKGAPREQFLAERLEDVCAAYKTAHSNTNKAYSDICGALGLRRKNGRQSIRPEVKEEVYNAVRERMAKGAPDKKNPSITKPIGYMKAIALMIDEKHHVLKLVPNTGKENIRNIYEDWEKGIKKSRDLLTTFGLSCVFYFKS